MTWRRFFGLAIIVPLLCASAPAQAIVCGEEVPPGEQPWLVQVVRLNSDGTAYDGEGRRVCSGSLINDRDVITAAHCLKIGQHPDDLGVIVWTKAGASEPYRVQRGLELAGSLGPDVAVLRLAKAVYNAMPVTWDEAAVEGADTSLEHIAGWGVIWPGYTTEGGNGNCPVGEMSKRQGTPHQGAVDLLDAARCRIKKDHPSGATIAGMVCAHGPAARPTGICSGDSGGPLLRIDDGGQARLFAIASRVPGLHETNPAMCIHNAGLFTEVAPLVGTIRATIAQLSRPFRK